MSERLKSLRRIQAVHKRLADMAEWKLAAAERAKADVAAERAALESFVAGVLPTGAFATLAGRTAVRLANREALAEHRRAELASSKIQAETRLELADRFLQKLAAEERDAEERRRLEALIEATPPATEADDA